MKRRCAIAAALLILAPALVTAADPPLVDGVSGAPVAWSDWLPRKGPVAVMIWASWAPGADGVLRQTAAIASACEGKGLGFVVLDVQETLEEARAALRSLQRPWIHDRHGALLKEYRVIRVPSLLLLSADGRVLGKIEATAEAVRAWEGP
jgi:hypothetical protein